jgi:hypothetical protein
MRKFGVPRKSVESGIVKLVRCGEKRGEIRPIESLYLEPEVHSLMEIDGFTVSPQTCGRLILLVSKTKNELKGTYVLKYINWGESRGLHNTSTCSARVTASRQWYDLTGHRRSLVLWPKERQYRNIAPTNPDGIVANCRLYGIYPHSKGDDPNIWGGVLNSSFALLSALQFGRPVGNEGNWSTMVADVNMMLVPNPSMSTAKLRDNVKRAFTKIEQRKALQFLSERRLRTMAYTSYGKTSELDGLSDLSELDMPDRRELDDAVLEMIGVKTPADRKGLIDALYDYLREFFEATRQKEEKAIINKNTSRRRERVRPSDIAAQIYKDISENEPDLLRQYDSHFLDKSQPFDTYDLPADGEAEPYSDMLVTQAVKFTKGTKTQVALIATITVSQAQLITLLANTGTRGLVRVPHEEAECSSTLEKYRPFINHRDEHIKALIQERTSDEDAQEKILVALTSLTAGR